MKQLHVLGRRMARLLASTRGAFDLTSVLVGAAVVAILVGGTAVTTFGIIPWAQDNGAQQNLSSVSTAQSVAKVREGKFTDSAGLTSASYLSAGPSLAVAADTNGSCWVGLSKSDTGKVFYSTSNTTNPQPFVSGTNTGCVAKTALRQLAVAVGAPLPIAKAAMWGSVVGSPGIVPGDVNNSAVLAGRNLTDVASGRSHTCFVADGKAYCQGYNTSGQIGTGTNNDAYAVVELGGVLAGKSVTDIAVSENASCAVADGAVYCWGDNSRGQLGNGDTTSRLAPTAVNTAGILNGKTMKSVTLGRYHACAITTDGIGACWGEGIYSKLGVDSGSASSSVPVPILTSGALAGAPISEISAGKDHTCAVANGKAYCWGQPGDGQLGVGAATGTYAGPRPVDTSGALAGKTVTAISTGDYHSCAIADGAVYCWGENSSGAVGTGNTTKYTSPTSVQGVLSGKAITSVAAGGYASCAITDGTAYCWGGNGSGQVGNGASVDTYLPAAVAGNLPGKNVLGISIGSYHTSAFYE